LSTGKTVRLNRIFSNDGRAVVIAMDHGLPGVRPLANLTKPEELIEQVVAGGADAILTTPGIAARFAGQIGRLGLIIRLDGGVTTMSESFSGMKLIASVEDALKLGADAVAVMGFCGTPDETSSLETLGRVAVECRRLGVPLMAEMVPLGFQGEPNVSQLAMAARIGAEIGADIIKTKYLGPPEAYRAVTDTCFVPVLMLGVSARSRVNVLNEVRYAMSAGVAGVAMGRNVWQSADVIAMTHAIAEAVHNFEGNPHVI
jgi:DhnA family fructose-bisphosphate aldolase class Ia